MKLYFFLLLFWGIEIRCFLFYLVCINFIVLYMNIVIIFYEFYIKICNLIRNSYVDKLGERRNLRNVVWVLKYLIFVYILVVYEINRREY